MTSAEHWAFVWSAYALTALTFAALTVWALWRLIAASRAALEQDKS